MVNLAETGSVVTARRHAAVLACLFLAFITVVVYFQVHSFDFVNYDDDQYVYDNRPVRAGLTLSGVKWAFTSFNVSYYHPVTWLSHMLDCRLFGLKAGYHHLVNLMFHIANGLLLFLLLARTTRRLWGPLAVACIFLLHPLNVESVAWISERKNMLACLFWLLTMVCYAWYAERPGYARYLVVIISFICGLMSKPVLVTLPFVLMLMDYWPLGRVWPAVSTDSGERRYPAVSAVRAVMEKLPLLLLVLVICWVTLIAQKQGAPW